MASSIRQLGRSLRTGQELGHTLATPGVFNPATSLTGPVSIRQLGRQMRGVDDEEEPTGIARFVSDLPAPVRESVGGALRGVASALAPLQLPQDVFFSVIAGSLDDETTITQRFQSMEWGKYMPGGDVPARPASGEEVFDLLGFEPQVAKWAGIAADLTADPLIFGSWLRLGGKLSGIQDLTRLGDRVDHFISPIGMGREVVGVARRSQHLSNFMDTRMDALARLIRNPDSTLFGIQRFGEKTTKVLDQILPRGQMLRIRFGNEMGAEMLKVVQMGKEQGRRVSEEALTMLQRAQQGRLGSDADDIVRMWIRTLEDQVHAYKNNLEGLQPIVRDAIEREAYNVNQNLGFLSVLEESRMAGRIADEQLAGAFGDIFRVIDRADDAGRQPLREILNEVASAGTPLLREARENVANVAAQQARRAAGATDQTIMQAERQAVDVFNRYLRDTALIDARLGLETSGFGFVSNQIRLRGLELTGESAIGDRAWQRLLAAGLRSKEDYTKLMGESTGIKLRSTISREAIENNERLRRRFAHRSAIEGEMQRIAGRNEAERISNIGTYTGQVEDLMERVGTLATAVRTSFRNFPDLTTKAARRNMQQLEEAVDSYGQAMWNMIGAGAEGGGSGAREVGRLMQVESRLQKLLRKQAELLEQVPTASYPPQTRWTVPESGRQWLREAQEQTASLIEDLGSAMLARKTAREQIKQAADARRVAAREARDVDGIPMEGSRRALDDIGRQAVREAVPQSDARTVAFLNDLQVPLAGRNATAEDILAARLYSRKYKTIQEALDAPITFSEMLDGMASMQALDLGDYLQGLMNGHLRRAYAIFQDPNDFKTYTDALRIGRIIPSRFMDEDAILPALAARNLDNEGRLIMEYKNAMTRGGRGFMLSHSKMADHLLASGADPARVRAAMRTMLETMHADNAPMRSLLHKLDEVVPAYRQAMKRREQASARFDSEQPRLMGERFFDPREELTDSMLEALGEYAMAQMSITESATIANRVVSRQDVLQNALVLGRRRGYVRDSPFTDEFGTRFVKYADEGTVIPGFAGKYIHPYLAQELQRATALGTQDIPAGLTRLRSLVTGGFLASPNVIAANFMGGLYQAATVGLNPFVMTRRLIETFGDVDSMARGRYSDLIAEMKRHMPLETSSLSYQDFVQGLRRVRLDEFGLDGGGIKRFGDQIAHVYEGFLQRPGIGKFRARYAGLEGFQFTENWMKVAGYAEMKSRLTRRLGNRTPTPDEALRIQQEAAEFARLIVFDYSELPRSLERLKNYGLVLFPGFTYFLAGRTLNAALRRPGAVAVADRISEAMSNASLSIEDQVALLLGTPDWMQMDQGVPMPFTVRRDEAGDRKVSVIPMAQLIPTQTLWDGHWGQGNPFAESVAGGGVWGPLAEVFMAMVRGDGEAPLSAQFGNRVFDADSRGVEKARDVTRFLFNTMAPSIVKKSITVDNNNELAGLFPSIPSMFRDLSTPMPTELAERFYSFDERRSGRPDKTWRENVLSSFLRSPQVIALDGPLAGIRRELTNARADLNRELSSLRTKFNRARMAQRFDEADKHRARMEELEREFAQEWQMYLDFNREHQERQQRSRAE